MPATNRKIIHIDMDCFYAAVEMRDNPKLKTLPIAVGGNSKRSVLCTANYIARQYGIHSALSSMVALKKCPQLIIIEPNFQKYKKTSEQVFTIMKNYSELFQPLSLDEAFIDVTEYCQKNNITATLLANQILNEIKSTTDLTASAGVSYNKYLAKIASDWKKPNGCYTIRPEQAKNFLLNLDTKYLPGVGPVTRNKMKNLGIVKVGELKAYGSHKLSMLFGKYGQRLFELASGIDLSEVKYSWNPKSISIERTFGEDINLVQLLNKLPNITEEFLTRFKQQLYKQIEFNKNSECPNFKRPKSLFVRIKRTDHQRKTIESSISQMNNINIFIQELENKILKNFDDFKKPEQLEKFFKSHKHKFEDQFTLLANTILTRHACKIRLFGMGIRYLDGTTKSLSQKPPINYTTYEQIPLPVLLE